METFAHIEEFERYADGKMAEQEEQQFAAELATDEQLAHEYAHFLKLRLSLRHFYFQELKQKLQQTDAQLPPSQNTLVFNFAPVYKYAAAACVGFILAGGLWFWKFNPNQQEKLITEHYLEDPGLPVLMSSSSKLLQDKAMNAYRTGNYQEALQKLREIPPQDLGEDTLRYYQAIFLLKLNQADSAIHYLSHNSFKDSAYTERAQYYKAMAYLKQGNVNEAKKQFTEISNTPDHTFKDVADKILASQIF